MKRLGLGLLLAVVLTGMHSMVGGNYGVASAGPVVTCNGYPSACPQQEGKNMVESKTLFTKGQIVELGQDYLVVKGQGNYDLVKVMLHKGSKAPVKPSAELEGEGKRIGLKLGLNTREYRGGTILVDGKNGRPLQLKNFKLGQEVSAYYGPMASRSYPPQVAGDAVILNSNPEKTGKYFVVDTVEMSADRKYVTVFSSSLDLIATIQGKACAGYRDIKPGTKLLLWSDIMTMSIPARTNATRAKILE